ARRRLTGADGTQAPSSLRIYYCSSALRPPLLTRKEKFLIGGNWGAHEKARRRDGLAQQACANYSTDFSSLPISDGLRVVRMPQASMTSGVVSAVSATPEMCAPAWPMRLPGGAVTPAMKPTTGFFRLSLAHWAAVTSSGPPISPIMMTASVSGSSLNSLSTSTCFRPLIGSPPMPTALDWPRPSSVTRSEERRAGQAGRGRWVLEQDVGHTSQQ